MKKIIKTTISLTLIISFFITNYSVVSFAGVPRVLNLGTHKRYYTKGIEDYYYDDGEIDGPKNILFLEYKYEMEERYQIFYKSSKLYVKNFKSSNPKVINKIEKGKKIKGTFARGNVDLKVKKTGTSVITGDIYYKGKFFRSFKTKYIINKYKNPFKKLKIGKRNYRKQFNKATYSFDYVSPLDKKTNRVIKYDDNYNEVINTEPLIGKLNYKLKKGFKLKKITIKGGKYKNKKLKNGSNLKLTSFNYECEKYYDISFKIYDKKHKMNYKYELSLSRWCDGYLIEKN